VASLGKGGHHTGGDTRVKYKKIVAITTSEGGSDEKTAKLGHHFAEGGD